jgi:hypothetical protein
LFRQSSPALPQHDFSAKTADQQRHSEFVAAHEPTPTETKRRITDFAQVSSIPRDVISMTPTGKRRR